MTIYVFSLELMDDDEDPSLHSLVDSFTAETCEECLAWFYETYDINDYCTSYTGPVN